MFCISILKYLWYYLSTFWRARIALAFFKCFFVLFHGFFSVSFWRLRFFKESFNFICCKTLDEISVVERMRILWSLFNYVQWLNYRIRVHFLWGNLIFNELNSSILKKNFLFLFHANIKNNKYGLIDQVVSTRLYNIQSRIID